MHEKHAIEKLLTDFYIAFDIKWKEDRPLPLRQGIFFSCFCVTKPFFFDCLNQNFLKDAKRPVRHDFEFLINHQLEKVFVVLDWSNGEARVGFWSGVFYSQMSDLLTKIIKDSGEPIIKEVSFFLVLF